MPDTTEIDASDCCGNGCTNCILDNKPKPTERALLAGKPNVILNYASFRLISNEAHNGNEDLRHLHFRYAGRVVAEEQVTEGVANSDGEVDTNADTEAGAKGDFEADCKAKADVDMNCDAKFDVRDDANTKAEAEVSNAIQLDDDGILDIPAGHHVMLRAMLSTSSPPLLRPYSPYWTDFKAKEFKILVKLQPNGLMSRYLAALRPQQLLQFRGPIGNYTHNAITAASIIIIAQGVAIAPTLPIIEQVLNNEDDMSRIKHLICARNLQHVYFRDRLLDYARYWNYNSFIYLAHHECTCCTASTAAVGLHCKQLQESLRYKEAAHRGRLDSKQLTMHMESSKQFSPIVVIIAGHSSFQQSMRKQAVNCFKVSENTIFLL